MTKWIYLGTALALALVALVTGNAYWIAPAGVMLLVTELRWVNDQRRAREAADRERR